MEKNIQASSEESTMPPLSFTSKEETPVPPKTPAEKVVVSLEQLANWKKEGDYEQLETHIRQGSLEILPAETLSQLLLLKNEHNILINTLQIALQSIEPMLQKDEEFAAYIDPESKLKINLSKLMEEFISIQKINPFSKKPPKPLPIVTLLKESIRSELFSNIDAEGLELTMKNNQLDFQAIGQFLLRLGLIEKETATYFKLLS